MQEPETNWRSQAIDEDAHVPPQVRQRLLHVDNQLTHLHAQVEHLVADAIETNSQLAALMRHITDPHALDGVHERLAELAVNVESNREQLDALTHQIADSAGREQLAELANTITKLGRTQFKSNALGETQGEQIERSLLTLQDLVTHREERQEQVALKRQEQFDAVRQEARGELAADLLPALDSVELALESGAALVGQQRRETAAWDQQQSLTTPQEEALPSSAGIWQKLRLKWAGHPTPALPEPRDRPRLPDAVTMMPEVMEAWLQGITLVRDRFLALLSGEGIEVIQALDKPFDPRLHVAIEPETRDDVPPNTVVRVLRKGYRQHHRVLRYAEVVVAQAVASPQPISSNSEDAHHA